MAKLSRFKGNSKIRETGEWIKPGDEWDDLEILTRGFTDVYVDARAAKIRSLAARLGGDVNKVSSAAQRVATIDCMIEHALLDVRGLADDAGGPISFAQFCALLRDPDYSDLYVAAIRASSMAGSKRAFDVGDAVGNSGKPSE